MTDILMQYTWKIGGEAGFGIMTTGLLFSKIVARKGNNLFDFVEYPSLIRGGHNAYTVTFSKDKVTCLKNTIDILVCLNKETYEVNKDSIDENGFVLYDPDDFSLTRKNSIPIPFSNILTELRGQVVMKNMIALGASLALLGLDLEELHAILEKQFGKKGSDIVVLNQQFAQKGYDQCSKEKKSPVSFSLPDKATSQKAVLTGNEAFSLGAVIADCRFYSAYPMTPSSTVLSTLADWQKKTGMVTRHAEDEIAVINEALGASFSGVRVAVGTSGGGFALMTEGVSLAGITEQPIVIFISQRPGPATGMPTWTEQADLLFAIHAGHGEFPKIVLAPGNHEDMVRLTIKAFDLADIYQTPVIVLSDMLLSESHASIDEKVIASITQEYKPSYGKRVLIGEKGYRRYKVVPDGISPRLIPGAKGLFYQSNSYEHLEDGHTTESAEERIKQVDKRMAKIRTYLSKDFSLPQVMGDGDIVLVGWGSTQGVLFETQKKLKNEGVSVGVLHFTHVYPLHFENTLRLFDEKKRYILVENNASGQFGAVLRMEAGFHIKEKIVRYDGRPITSFEIQQYLKTV